MSIGSHLDSVISSVHQWVHPNHKRTTLQWVYFVGSILLLLALLFIIFKFGIMKALGGKKPPPMTEEEMEMRGGGGGDLEAGIVAASGNAENYVGDDDEDEDEDEGEGGSIVVVVGNDCGRMELSGVDRVSRGILSCCFRCVRLIENSLAKSSSTTGHMESNPILCKQAGW